METAFDRHLAAARTPQPVLDSSGPEQLGDS